MFTIKESTIKFSKIVRSISILRSNYIKIDKR